MAIPDYQSLMLPLLRFAAKKGTETSTSEAVEALAAGLGLSDEDLKEMLPSGIQSTFVNRVGWASTYMKKAGLLEATRRGFYRITDRGRDFLKKQPEAINVKLLKQYPEFLEFQRLKGTRGGDKATEPKGTSDLSAITPSEELESAMNIQDWQNSRPNDMPMITKDQEDSGTAPCYLLTFWDKEKKSWKPHCATLPAGCTERCLDL